MNFLVVDDEPFILDLTEMVLKGSGHSVTSALNAEQALTLFQNGSYDLVMTDLTMSGMDGLALAKKLKTERPQQKIALLTGSGGTAETFTDVDYVVSKPITLDKLATLLANLAKEGV